MTGKASHAPVCGKETNALSPQRLFSGNVARRGYVTELSSAASKPVG